MELRYEADKEHSESTFYVQQLPSNNTDLCIICQVDETQDGKQWDRYSSKCGHVFHSRCFRRWCGVRGAINCPYCGDIPEVKKFRFCSTCRCYGHSDAYDGWQECTSKSKARKTTKTVTWWQSNNKMPKNLTVTWIWLEMRQLSPNNTTNN